jgi:hypothetical protein
MGDNHQKNRSLQRDARALAKEQGIKYTAALRILLKEKEENEE